jgi:hypothetical protein
MESKRIFMVNAIILKMLGMLKSLNKSNKWWIRQEPDEFHKFDQVSHL